MKGEEGAKQKLITELTRMQCQITSLEMNSSEYRRIREMLYGNGRQSEVILAAVGVGIIVLDRQGRCIFTNPAAAKLLGYKVMELVGRNCLLIAHPFRSGDGIYDKKEGSLFPRGESEVLCRTGEDVFWRKDGTSFPVEFVKTALVEDGRQTGVVIGFSDITERKRDAEKLLIRNKLAFAGSLTAIVAHEINNPLTGIMGFAQLLAARQDIPGDIKEDLKRICTESQRAVTVVKKLLRFVHQSRPDMKRLDINELIEQTLKLRSQGLTTNTELQSILSPHLRHVLADYYQIQQVILNIMSYFERAAGILDGRRGIGVETSQGTGCIKISISANGCGAAGENVSRVFDSFFAAPGGIELGICHSIVAGHGGSIKLESLPGQQTRFTIELPLPDEYEPGSREGQLSLELMLKEPLTGEKLVGEYS